MQTASDRFDETVKGTHRAVARVQILTTIQFGPTPTGGVLLPLLDGNVRSNALSDIKSTLALTVPGDYWDLLQPYGCECFAERGVDFGDGTQEYLPLGYFRVEALSQQENPFGPVAIDASDRGAQLLDTRVIYPYQVPAGTTHRQVFDRLVNGTVQPGETDQSGTYGMYLSTNVPIFWDDAGYDPDAVVVSGDVVVDDSVYEFLAKLVDSRDALITFRPTGEMAIVARTPALDVPPDFTLREGRTGLLTRASRSVRRDGVYNIVRSVGSDPAVQTGYQLAYNNDPLSPLYWAGSFGPAVRYYESPLLEDAAGADAAAETILRRATGLPEELSVWTVPDPRVQPLDVVAVHLATLPAASHIVDEVTIPLVGGEAVEIRTRTRNPVVENPSDPDPPVIDPPVDPDPDPGDPPTQGGGDPSDGVQAAIVNGWGSIITGDEFDNYTGRPKSALWGLYDGPGHAGNGRRSPDAFNVHDGIMTVHGDENDVSGGTAFTYRTGRGGRYEVRARCYNTGTNGGGRYHPVLILWPDNDQWPSGAEYDFMECDEGTGEFNLFMHLPNHDPYRQDHYGQNLDIQNYHNYAVEWNPDARTLRAWIDGVKVYDGVGRVADAPGPMHLTIQLDNFGGDPRPANFDIAWVRVYQRPNA